MVGGFGCTAIILIFLVLPIAGFFAPLGLICYFFAWFAGAATILFTLGALQGFDISEPDDWKMLAFSLLIPGGITAALVGLGKLLGDHYIFELVEVVKNLF